MSSPDAAAPSAQIHTSVTARPFCRRVLGSTFAALALLTSACGTSSSDAEATTETPTTTSDKPTSQELATTTAAEDEADNETATTDAEIWPRDINHALGTTTVPSRPMRVVALDMSLVDATLALGVELSGYTTYSSPDGPLPERFSSSTTASEAIWVGDLLSPNLEAIAVLRPDLIVTAAARHEDLYAELSAIAPTVVSESAGGGWKDTLRLVAQATGTEARAEALLGAYETRAAEVGSAINESAGNPTVSVVRFVGAIRLYQPTSFSGQVLVDADLARPPSQQEPEDFITIISEELLAEADADVLIYSVFGNPAVEDSVAEMQGRALWSNLNAVQTDQAYPVSDESWMSGVGIYGAHIILDNLATIFSTEPYLSTESERP